MSGARQAFHVAVVAYYALISLCMNETMLKLKGTIDDPLARELEPFPFRYITIWTFILQPVYFLVALGEDILYSLKGLEKVKVQVNKFKSYFFTVLAAPMALVVSFSFWSICFVDRELIVPRFIDSFLPSWVNHSLHTTTSILVLIEMYLTSHKYPPFKSALLGISRFFAVYYVCLFGTYIQTGIWLYILFNKINWNLRILICLAGYLLAVVSYGIGYIFSKVLWDENAPKSKAPKENHKMY